MRGKGTGHEWGVTGQISDLKVGGTQDDDNCWETVVVRSLERLIGEGRVVEGYVEGRMNE